MTHRLGWMAWATGTVVLVVVSACGGGAGTDPSPTPPSSPVSSASSPASPTTSSTSASPEDAATAAVVALMRRYFAVLDAVRQDPSLPLSRLSSVMTSVELTTQHRLVEGERQQHLRQTGETAIDRFTVQSVNLDDSVPSAGRVPTVTIDVCWDVSGADLVDKKGHSVVSATRPDRGWARYTVANHHWSTNPSGGWRVADGQDLKRTPCAAS